jgi:hypothetical protein
LFLQHTLVLLVYGPEEAFPVLTAGAALELLECTPGGEVVADRVLQIVIF